MDLRAPLPIADGRGDAQAAGQALGIALQGGFEQLGRGRIAPLPAPDPPADGLDFALRFAAQALVDLGELGAEALPLAGEHGGFLFPPRLAAPENELLLAAPSGCGRSLASRPGCTSLQPSFSRSAASNFRNWLFGVPTR